MTLTTSYSTVGTRLGNLVKQSAPNIYSSEIVSDNKRPYNKAQLTNENPYGYDLDRIERLVNRMYTADSDALEHVDIHLGGVPKDLILGKLTDNARRLGPEGKYNNLKLRERLKRDYPSQYEIRDSRNNTYAADTDSIYSHTGDVGEIAGRLGTAAVFNEFNPDDRDIADMFIGVSPSYANYLTELGYDRALDSNMSGGALRQEPWDTVGPDIEAILNSKVRGLFKNMRRRRRLAKSKEEYNQMLLDAAERIKSGKVKLPKKKVKTNKPDTSRPKTKTGHVSKDGTSSKPAR